MLRGKSTEKLPELSDLEVCPVSVQLMPMLCFQVSKYMLKGVQLFISEVTLTARAMTENSNTYTPPKMLPALLTVCLGHIQLVHGYTSYCNCQNRKAFDMQSTALCCSPTLSN